MVLKVVVTFVPLPFTSPAPRMASRRPVLLCKCCDPYVTFWIKSFPRTLSGVQRPSPAETANLCLMSSRCMGSHKPLTMLA